MAGLRPIRAAWWRTSSVPRPDRQADARAVFEMRGQRRHQLRLHRLSLLLRQAMGLAQLGEYRLQADHRRRRCLLPASSRLLRRCFLVEAGRVAIRYNSRSK